MTSPDVPDDPSLEFKIRLAVEEVVENVVNYAYQSGDGFLEVGTHIDDGILSITFCDGGIRFDPLAKPDPDLTLSVEERQIGGLGIFLCKQMMDSVSYKYEDGCNKLLMTKKVS